MVVGRQTSADNLLFRIHMHTLLLARLLETAANGPTDATDAAVSSTLLQHLSGGLALVPWVAALFVALIARRVLSWSGALRHLLLPLLDGAVASSVRDNHRSQWLRRSCSAGAFS